MPQNILRLGQRLPLLLFTLICCLMFCLQAQSTWLIAAHQGQGLTQSATALVKQDYSRMSRDQITSLLQQQQEKHQNWAKLIRKQVVRTQLNADRDKPIPLHDYYNLLVDFYALLNTDYTIDHASYHSNSMDDFTEIVMLCRVILVRYGQIFDQQEICPLIIPLAIISGTNPNYWQSLGIMGAAKAVQQRIAQQTANDTDYTLSNHFNNLEQIKLPFILTLVSWDDIDNFIGEDYIFNFLKIRVEP